MSKSNDGHTRGKCTLEFKLEAERLVAIAAPSCSLQGDVSANVLRQADFIAAAHAAPVNLLLFPELPLLNACAVHPSDECFAPIRTMVKKTGMTVVVGVPLATGLGLPAIAAFTFSPAAEFQSIANSTCIRARSSMFAPEKVFSGPQAANWWSRHQALEVNSSSYREAQRNGGVKCLL